MSRPSAPTALRGAILASALAALAAPAVAKAPTGVPNLEELLQKAQLAHAEAERIKAEALRDPRRETIDNFRNKKTELKDFQPVVEMILDAKTEELQAYRAAAADALLVRFAAEDPDNNPVARKLRLDVAIELVELLNRPASDDKGLLAGEAIFTAWYPGQIKGNYWKRDGKPAERKKAYEKIKKWLKDSRK